MMGTGRFREKGEGGGGLARQGKRVLLLDCDSQRSLTVSMGERDSNRRTITLASVMSDVMNERDFAPATGILRHSENVDFLPTNSELTGVELALTQLIGRETILRQFIDKVKLGYDFVIIDTAPALDLMTINALAAADSVIIPVCPKFLDALGLEQLLKAISQIRRQINPNLAVEGILLTMVDRRTKLTRKVIASIENAYGANIKIFNEYIALAFNTAVELSYLSYDEQFAVAGAMANYDIKPSLSQAVRLKKMKRSGTLTAEQIDEVLSEVKESPISETKITLRYRKFFPPEYSTKQVERVIIRLLKDWQKGQSEV